MSSCSKLLLCLLATCKLTEKQLPCSMYLRGKFNDAYVICILIFLYKSIYCWYSLNYLDKIIKANVVGTHLNCIDKSVQFKWVSTTHAIIMK